MALVRSLRYLLVLIVFISIPLLIQDHFQRHILIMFCIFAMASLAIDLTSGHLAELPFGYCALWGTGAYTLAIVTSQLGWSFWVACLLAGCTVSAAALLMAIPLVRVKGAQFAFLTLGFALSMRLVVKNWDTFTGGVYGISGLPSPTLNLPVLPKISLSSEFSFLYLAMAGLLLTIFVYHRVTSSAFGRAITAIRENDALASSVGISILKYKLATFAIMGFLAGISGALYAGYMRVVVPAAYDIWYSVVPLVIMLVGGERYIGGALAGTFFVIYIPEYLRLAGETRMLIFGLIIISAILFMPEGIWPTLKRKLERTRIVQKLIGVKFLMNNNKTN